MIEIIIHKTVFPKTTAIFPIKRWNVLKKNRSKSQRLKKIPYRLRHPPPPPPPLPNSVSPLPAKGLRDGGGGGGCSILGTVRQLRGPSNDDDAALFRADIAVLRLLRLSSRGMGGPGWLRSGAAGEDIKGRGRGGVQLRHVSATYILVRLILPGGIIARGRRERFHYTASRGIIFSDISLAAPAGLKFRPSTVSASPSAPLLPGDPPRPTPSRNDGGNCRRVHAREGFRSRKMADSWFNNPFFFSLLFYFILEDLDFLNFKNELYLDYR